MVLATRRISDDVAVLTVLLTLLAKHTGAVGGGKFVAVDVAVGTDRCLLVAALRVAGHRLFEINPKAVSRHRDRHAVSGAKSDPGDALVIAQLLRTDGHGPWVSSSISTPTRRFCAACPAWG
ncbi:MAG: IS110 family transposase [Pseudonocardiaceae bacterium]